MDQAFITTEQVHAVIIHHIYFSLEECYKMEEQLCDEDFAKYMQILGTVVHQESFGVDKLCRKLPCHATSLQRCKAYLKLKKIPYNV